MTSRYGRGFVINLCYLKTRFSFPADKAWFGAQDFMIDLTIPPKFKGTEIEEMVGNLRKLIMWHQPGGPMDREQYDDVNRLLGRILIAIDTELGIEKPDLGSY